MSQHTLGKRNVHLFSSNGILGTRFCTGQEEQGSIDLKRHTGRPDSLHRVMKRFCEAQ